MIRFLSLALLGGLFVVTALHGADKRAKTEDGRDVILRDDGTWTYADKTKSGKEAVSGKKSSSVQNRPTNAKLAYTGKRGTFALYLVPDVWKKSAKPINAAAEVQFSHKDGDVVAMVIAERLEMPLARLKEAAITNARNADKNAKIIRDEKRQANGKEMIHLAIEASTMDIPVTFLYYLYTGSEGSFQVITWTGRNLFSEYKNDMEALLNGFEIVKKKDAKPGKDSFE